MLKNKKIIITGASRGIGREIAKFAAQNGATVGINYLKSVSDASNLAEEIVSKGYQKPTLLKFDACNTYEIKKGVENFLQENSKIDGWVNNASINISGLLPMLSDEEINRQINSALIGPILCCKIVLEHMLPNKMCSIVNIGSIVTEKAFRGQRVYAAAKGGILSFTKALAFEYSKKGIRVNCVQPGSVDTEMMKAIKILTNDQISFVLV
ncbi:hypothetical protein BVX93_02185, partial [bacterium B13(2017)]